MFFFSSDTVVFDVFLIINVGCVISHQGPPYLRSLLAAFWVGAWADEGCIFIYKLVYLFFLSINKLLYIFICNFVCQRDIVFIVFIVFISISTRRYRDVRQQYVDLQGRFLVLPGSSPITRCFKNDDILYLDYVIWYLHLDT